MSDTKAIEALLEAHELIVVEREQARHEFAEDDEFKDGHMNGLSEARNRVEQCILDRVNNLECHKESNTGPPEELIKEIADQTIEERERKVRRHNGV